MWEAITSFFAGTSVLKRVVIHAFIVVGFLLALGAVSHHLKVRAFYFANGWRQQLGPVTCTKDIPAIDLSPTIVKTKLSPAQDGAPATVVPISEEEQKAYQGRLAGQFHEVQQRITHHFDQLITYYSYSFATTIMVGLLAAVAAITLVFITLKGWEPANEYQKTIFLLATVTATYCAAFPGVFQLQKNVDDNRFLYLKYVSLANEMCSYQSTGEAADKSVVDPNVFIHRIDTELSNLNKIAVGFDVSQIPDFSKALSQATGQTPGSQTTGQPSSKPPGAKKPAKRQ